MEHFPASKPTVAPATATLKRKGAPQGPRPRSVGPSAGSAGDAGAEKRVSKPKRLKKKAKKRVEKEKAEDGGFALAARGEVRGQGIAVPAGTKRTCLADAMWAAMRAVLPQTKLPLATLRKSLPASDDPDQPDPTALMAKEFAAGYGLDFHYDRELNNPRALFERRSGVYLIRLELSTHAGRDYHYVTYLSASGHVIDNEPRALVPVVQDEDRKSNKHAIRVFQQLFPRALRIQMLAVNELRVRPCSTCIEPVSTRPTKPSLDDLFVELYTEGVISHDALIECICPTID